MSYGSIFKKKRIQPKVDDLPLDTFYTSIEAERTRLPRCTACTRPLEPGTKHWLYKEPKNNMWWCVVCYKKHCGFSPPE